MCRELKISKIENYVRLMTQTSQIHRKNILFHNKNISHFGVFTVIALKIPTIRKTSWNDWHKKCEDPDGKALGKKGLKEKLEKLRKEFLKVFFIENDLIDTIYLDIHGMICDLADWALN